MKELKAKYNSDSLEEVFLKASMLSDRGAHLIKSFEISKMMLKMWQKEMGKLFNTGTKSDRRAFLLWR
ncbi:hypothetical protein PO124_29120 [Bacillus licheniformis]|nr:hypothetical protein [Bacillus licheniformis]